MGDIERWDELLALLGSIQQNVAAGHQNTSLDQIGLAMRDVQRLHDHYEGAVSAAYAEGFEKGRADGFNEGRAQGYTEGQRDNDARYHRGQSEESRL